MADEPTIKDLRWRVTLAQRVQSPDSTVGINETWVGQIDLWASIKSVGALTFWGITSAAQAERPVTHTIILRWIGYIDNTYAILRKTQFPAIGQPSRVEVFRIRRVTEWAGRKRWTVLDTELEGAQS
jgi:head-tail adaptor